MAPTPRRQLNNYRYWDCAVHGTYKENRGQNGYSFTAVASTQSLQVLQINYVRANPEGQGYPVCAACGAYLSSRAITDYATGQEDRRHECGPKCMAATGPNCECRCKGANHGA
jgi:hypothetical protein